MEKTINLTKDPKSELSKAIARVNKYYRKKIKSLKKGI